MTRRASLLIVDDHPLAREGVRSIMAAEGFDVIAEAASGEEAVAKTSALSPDLVLMDIRLSGAMDGLAAAAAIAASGSAAKVLMLTLHDEPNYVQAALAAGACGYVLKDASREELRDAVHLALAGQVAVQASLMSKAIGVRARSTPESLLSRLTTRERAVLDLVAGGLTNKAIGRVLQISPATVKAHVERIIAKLGVADRTQAAVLVARLSLSGDEG